MAGTMDTPPSRLYIHRQPDILKWLPSFPSMEAERCLALGSWSYDSGAAAVEILALELQGKPSASQDDEAQAKPSVRQVAAWENPGRITDLQVLAEADDLMLVSGSSQGDLTVIFTDAHQNQAFQEEEDGMGKFGSLSGVHRGAISAIDVRPETKECLSAGQDGRICMTNLGLPNLEPLCLSDSQGSVTLSAVRWTSPAEFVSASSSGGLQWWDRRHPEKPAGRCHLRWGADGPGSIHTIDVHPSRKHICAVGGSGGSLLAWDLRYPQQPVVLACRPDFLQLHGEAQVTFAQSEVWQVKFDQLSQRSDLAASGDTSARLPPVVACSEDGVLAVVGGGDVLELAVESCAINAFDIDSESGQDIICGLEQECLLYMRRPRH